MTSPEQLSLGGTAEPSAEPTLLLMSLGPPYMEQIRSGRKHYEYRRRFRSDRTSAFIYETGHVKAVTAFVRFGSPIVGSPEEIAEIARGDQHPDPEAVRAYLDGSNTAAAVPILGYEDVPPVSLSELKRVHPRFMPPQGYNLLANNPDLQSFLVGRLPESQNRDEKQSKTLEIRQLLVDAWGCTGPLDDAEELVESLRHAAAAIGASERGSCKAIYAPHGVTAVLLLAESHISVSTWPEHDFALVDILFCSPGLDPEYAWLALEPRIRPASTTKKLVTRSIPGPSRIGQALESTDSGS